MLVNDEQYSVADRYARKSILLPIEASISGKNGSVAMPSPDFSPLHSAIDQILSKPEKLEFMETKACKGTTVSTFWAVLSTLSIFLKNLYRNMLEAPAHACSLKSEGDFEEYLLK